MSGSRRTKLPRVRRLVALLAAVAVLTGCGGSKSAAPPTATVPALDPASILGAGAQTLYGGGVWAVVLRGGKAVAAHVVRGHWRADRSRGVTIAILGPKGTAAKLPQVAAELRAKRPFVESGLWVDGRELLEKGGGLSPTRVTIYGAPETPLAPGAHVAVAYGRTRATATAVAWTFTVR